jgi:hypothetical protein
VRKRKRRGEERGEGEKEREEREREKQIQGSQPYSYNMVSTIFVFNVLEEEKFGGKP